MKKYGLLGKNISYSLSPFIHNFLIKKYNLNAKYELVDIDDLSKLDFSKYDGLNVTTPYKEEVLKYCKDKSNLKIVNTLKGNYAYNTDILAFDKFYYKNIKKIKAVGILGNSATAKMLKKYFDKLKIEVFIFSRDNGISYSDILDYDFDFLINTTPLGQGKYKKKTALEYDVLKKMNLKYVLDFNYNPINTKLLLDSKKLSIKSFSGLEILILQAIYSFEIFTDVKVNKKYFKELFLMCSLKLSKNTIVYGMPLSGKSRIYKNLKAKKDVFDLDLEIEKNINMKIKDFINKNGIKEFRCLENKLIKKYLSIPNSTIIVGGGFFTNLNNFDLMDDVSLIYYKVTYKQLLLNYNKSKTNRPLIKNIKDLDDLYKNRKKLYENAFNICEFKSENIIKVLNLINKNNLI